MAALMPETGQTERMWGKSLYAHPGTNLGTGNRCGHNPEQFAADRLDLPKVKAGHGYLPRVLTKTMKRCIEFFNDPSLMKSLGFHKDKFNLDGSNRQVRSEDREAVALVYQSIVSCTDLASFRVGHYLKDGQFRNYTALELAERCGMVRVGKDPDQPGKLKRFPTSRFWRAFKRLKGVGAIEVFEQFEEKENGDMRGRPAIKTVSEKFMRRLGSITGGVMKKARANAYQRTAVFLARARVFGIQTVQEADELDSQIQVDLMLREVFGTSAKNAKPNRAHKTVKVNVHRDAIEHDALRAEWEAYYAKIVKSVEAALGRPLRGPKEQVEAPKKAGALDFHKWLLAQGIET